ncbi:MAG: hypothetical protein ACYCS7_09330 [Acidimicrobiales bacterium]
MSAPKSVAEADRLARLDAETIGFFTGGRLDRVVAELDVLLQCNFTGHPWAEMSVGAACAEVHRDDAAELRLTSAESQFVKLADRRGLGWLAYVRATVALGRGRFGQLSELLSQVRVELADDPDFPADCLAHLGLATFYRGEAREAARLAEQALALARSRSNRRQEGVSLVYLAFFELWCGRFRRAERLMDAAEDIYEEMADPRTAFELPMVLALRAALAALRGQPTLADEHFAAALRAALELDIEWYQAIIQAQRAYFLAAEQPRRSLVDARQSYERLVAMGDEWWQTWALRAQGVADCEVGNLSAAEETLIRALERSPGRQESALTLIALGDTRLRAGDGSTAAEYLRAAFGLAQQAEADYLVAWTAALLARIELDRASVWIGVVREHDDGDPAYERLLRTDLRITVLGEAGVWRGTQRVGFPTRHAELAVYALAIAEPHSLHEEVLGDRLWPEAPTDKLVRRLGTLVWQMRRSLGPDGWRLGRRGGLISLDLRGVRVDVVEATKQAALILSQQVVDPETVAPVSSALGQVLLPAWRYEAWVQDEASRLDAIRYRVVGAAKSL